MQRNVEGAHLVPKAVELPGEIVGRHVVFGTPHGAIVGEAQFARALVGQVHVAHEIRTHGFGDGMPAAPDVEQFPGVAAFGHDLGNGFDILAALRAVGTVLAFSVGAFQGGGDAGQLLAFFGVVGGREDQRSLEQLDFARRHRIEAEAVETGGLFGEIHLGVDGTLIELGGDGFGVAGDVSIFDPVGARRIDVENEQFLLRIVNEDTGLFGSGPAGGAGAQQQGGGEQRRSEYG